jgi:single-strand DNA-binding protein
MRALPSGQNVASFGIATNRFYNKGGKQEKQTEFHNIVAFGRLAEIASQYLSRGKMVFVEGRIQTRTWDAKDGTKKNRTEVVIETMQLGPRTGGYGDPAEKSTESNPPASPSTSQGGSDKQADKEEIETIEYPVDDINPDEIPF